MRQLTENQTSVAVGSCTTFLQTGRLGTEFITSGFCDSGSDISFPRGVMDACPVAYQRALNVERIETSVDVVAFPGIRLVGEHDKKGAEPGMAINLKHEGMEETPRSFEEVVKGYGPTMAFIALGVNDDENNVLTY
ncbi:hypothetical protein Clacol_009949 [Clathrus columnatus]|uniref:Uncharacterized protein n=1 Tax=Clathrus columnatus TaxID=1419009 RepID=A0AAV5ASB7_9AGAM|nr:hypothetical protein Clacol_009949 [Clathrus columnatus]